MACGGLHSAVSTAGQLVFAFGFNRYGQCGQGNCSNKLSTPRPVNVNIIGTPIEVQSIPFLWCAYLLGHARPLPRDSCASLSFCVCV